MTALKGKVALVTGGSRGIGAAIVRRLAKDGASVAFTYSSSKDAADRLAAEVAKATGAKVVGYQADASKVASLGAMVKQVHRDFGSLDILVNNAGVFTVGPIGETLQDEYEHVMKVNVDAVFATTNAAVPLMKQGARIINISSCLGARAGAGMSAYVASKFAVNGLTGGWARDLAAKGILVNSVLPGPINTDMNPDEGEFADAMRKQVPLGRYGQPDEISGVVAFLAGPDASYITGATLTVDGGINA